MKQTLRDRALRTILQSRFVAREEDLGHELTDEEVMEEASYLLETISYGGVYEGAELRKAKRQLNALLK